MWSWAVQHGRVGRWFLTCLQNSALSDESKWLLSGKVLQKAKTVFKKQAFWSLFLLLFLSLSLFFFFLVERSSLFQKCNKNGISCLISCFEWEAPDDFLRTCPAWIVLRKVVYYFKSSINKRNDDSPFSQLLGAVMSFSVVSGCNEIKKLLFQNNIFHSQFCHEPMK